METKPTFRFYDWAGRHIRLLAATLVLVVIGLGVAGPLVANTDEPNFDPSGEMFEVAERADATLRSDSTIAQATFITEAADGGDVLTADAFREWYAAEQRVLASEANAPHLAERYDADAGTPIPGVLSIVDIVADTLPNGLDGVTDAEVKAALTPVLADDSPFAEMAFSMSEQATVTESPDGPVWTAPAFTTQVVYDESSFAEYADSELWLRDVQDEFRGGAGATATSCGCPDLGPGTPFGFTTVVSRAELTGDFNPWGAIEDVASEAVAGTTTVTTNGCPGEGIGTTSCEIANGSADAFAPDLVLDPGGTVPGLKVVGKGAGSAPSITLRWNPSCSFGDTDYEVYQGNLDALPGYDHEQVLCSTAGAAAATFNAGLGDHYYLVVPTDGSEEGSYGVDGTGAQRPHASVPCRNPVAALACP